MARPTWVNTWGGFTDDENARLSKFQEEERLLLDHRPTLDEDWEACCKLHETARCSWWRRGVGVLVSQPGFHPANRLADEP